MILDIELKFLHLIDLSNLLPWSSIFLTHLRINDSFILNYANILTLRFINFRYSSLILLSECWIENGGFNMYILIET
jgi:hypothetical protein